MEIIEKINNGKKALLIGTDKQKFFVSYMDVNNGFVDKSSIKVTYYPNLQKAYTAFLKRAVDYYNVTMKPQEVTQ